jgi:hypothetical protein
MYYTFCHKMIIFESLFLTRMRVKKEDKIILLCRIADIACSFYAGGNQGFLPWMEHRKEQVCIPYVFLRGKGLSLSD